ncbi:helix-turn-helix transcriptional regulator [Kribbella sp. NPDC049584]|uniref:helix-turn-helix transcriptional regulator n=1 Tax=Kribbella sp. NPDC049584 TaxID=3154833 RepID=UPI003425921C
MSAAERRTAWWLEVVCELLARPTSTFPRIAVSNELATTFGTQVSWDWMDPSGETGFDLHTPIRGWPTPDVVSHFRNAIGHHPIVAWYVASGDPAPMSIGRVPQSLITDLGRQTVKDYLVPIAMEQQLSIPYRFGPCEHRAFILARGDDDFSEEDLRVALRIQTLLLLLDRQCAVLRRCTAENMSSLTGRELAVLRLLADGLTASAIGHRLRISPRTVHRHLQSIYRKLAVSDRLRAVAVAHEGGLLRELDSEPEISSEVTVRVFASPVAYPNFESGGLLPTAASPIRPYGAGGLSPIPVGVTT